MRHPEPLDDLDDLVVESAANFHLHGIRGCQSQCPGELPRIVGDRRLIPLHATSPRVDLAPRPARAAASFASSSGPFSARGREIAVFFRDAQGDSSDILVPSLYAADVNREPRRDPMRDQVGRDHR